jgi:hypothetical protein
MRLRYAIIGSVVWMTCATGCEETEPASSGRALIVAGATIEDGETCASSAFTETCIEAGGFDTTCDGDATLCCIETKNGDALCVDDPALVEPGATLSGIEEAATRTTNPRPLPTSPVCWQDCHTEWVCKGPISGPTCMTVPVQVCYTRCILL